MFQLIYGLIKEGISNLAYYGKMIFKKVHETLTLILQHCTGDNLIDYKVYGNSTQNSTTGKNKLNANWERGWFNYLDGTTGSSTNEIMTNIFPILPNTTYTASCDEIMGGFAYICYQNDGTTVIPGGGSNNVTNKYYTFTTPANAYYARIRIGNSTYRFTVLEHEQMLETGSTATSYEPYTGGISSPNPSYPQEITSVGDLVTSGEHVGKYKIPVTISGKNLFDNSVGGQVGEYLTREGNVSTGANTLRYTNYIAIKNNQANITISGMTNTMASPSLCFYDENKNFISGFNYNSMSEVTLTIPNNAVYLRTSYRTSNTQTQIEYGSSATTYEPYHTPITTDIYLDEPLRKVGTVADYIDFVTGKRHNLCGEVLLNGSETWKKSGVNYSLEKTLLPNSNIPRYSNNYLCTHFIPTARSSANLGEIYSGNSNLNFNYDNLGTELQTFKTWLSTHNTELIYQLATETTEDITLPDIPTFEGTTIITIGTEVQPSNMWVKYYANE